MDASGRWTGRVAGVWVALAAAGLAGSLTMPAASATARTQPALAPRVHTQPAGDLPAVSCTSAASCVAVGWYEPTGTSQVPLAEVWNGANWTVELPPNPAGSDYAVMTGVSCVAGGTCIAVGYSGTSSGVNSPTAESWNGSSWSFLSPGSPQGAVSTVLTAITCQTAGNCTAVGQWTNSSGGSLSMAEAWNGTDWTVTRTPAPRGSAGNYLNAVSCAGGTCIAVGSYLTSTSFRTLAETSSGGGWTIVKTPDVKNATYNTLYGLSCTSGTSCLATGYSFNGSSTSAVVLAALWNGTKWTSKRPSRPPGSDSRLVSVSCAAAGSCIAVGSYTTTTDIAETLAEAWNGTKWARQRTPKPKGSGSYGLAAVSCGAATACTATGDQLINAIDTAVPLADGWNGTKWAIEKTPPS
jgi:hypothetical protein